MSGTCNLPRNMLILYLLWSSSYNWLASE